MLCTLDMLFNLSESFSTQVQNVTGNTFSGCLGELR